MPTNLYMTFRNSHLERLYALQLNRSRAKTDWMGLVVDLILWVAGVRENFIVVSAWLDLSPPAVMAVYIIAKFWLLSELENPILLFPLTLCHPLIKKLFSSCLCR